MTRLPDYRVLYYCETDQRMETSSVPLPGTILSSSERCKMN